MITEVRTRWTELLELEEMLPQLVVRALKLPPGAERRDTLILIGSFRDRIIAMKWAELNRATAHRRKRLARKRNAPNPQVPSPQVTPAVEAGTTAGQEQHEKALSGAGASDRAS